MYDTFTTHMDGRCTLSCGGGGVVVVIGSVVVVVVVQNAYRWWGYAKSMVRGDKILAVVATKIDGTGRQNSACRGEQKL